ncbi:MAG: sn-glycerol-3-phosphate ABC transporter ATP-binding protein UgpC [Calditrichia bacterium]
MASVGLRNVYKVYDNKVTAIENATLDIADREFVVLVGPSGCGKSTLLRMIAGLEEITSGEITIDGRVVNNVPPKDRDIAMVFQNYALYPHMSVFDNMAFGLKLRKFSKDEIRRRVIEAAEILDIQNFLDRKPKALSGGQRQRVAVGRAIVRKPKVFLFDEPLSNLDAKLRVQMRIEINRLHNRLQTTMIYVTHDQIEAMTMGDKIVVLKDGVIQQVDSPLNLYNNPTNKFVAGFIGSPAMNFIDGEIVSENQQLQFHSGIFKFTIPPQFESKLAGHKGRKVTLGVRPEHMYDTSLVRDKKISEPQTIQVDVVEPIGNEIFVYFSENGHNFCMRMSPERIHKVGERVQIALDLDKIYIFNPESEERII